MQTCWYQWLAIFWGLSATVCGREPPQLWDQAVAVPAAADLPPVLGVRLHVIKPYEFDRDGYRFLHGVALAWHHGRLYASFGHNRGGENTDTEEARVCHSDDGGRSWSGVTTIDAGLEPGIGVSHGVFLSLGGRLWAFHGAYTGTMQQVHTRGYLLNEASGEWEPQGVLISDGFWPLGEPWRLTNGNWIMAGFCVGGGNPAAVAISHGDDLRRWDLVVIPRSQELGEMWGESAVIADGPRVFNIARYGHAARALLAVSDDFGRSWTASVPVDLPMATSKPCAGVLSNGQRFLINSISADGGKRRSPLTIAVSRPGANVFSRIFMIRDAVCPESSVESHPAAALSYPCATEYAGHLYVGYSNNGGNVGRRGTGRELWNNNSAELAVIPIQSLQVTP